ncbi:MAG: protease Do [Fibrobacteres bacterium]|nr:protease Do [Fibrobacterota bacterium]
MGTIERKGRPFLVLALAGTAVAVLAAGAHGGKADPDDDSIPGKGSGRFLTGQEACRDVFADVAEKVIPSVVSVYSTRNAAPWNDRDDEENDDGDEDGPGRGRRGAGRHENGLGSGVIVGPNGLILTNNHVTENARSLRVRLSDDREFDAEIIAADKTADLAVIRLKGKPGKLPSLPLGDSEKLRVGEWVVAVGSPYGLSETVTTGIISAKGRRNPEMNPYGNFIQTDAAINPGNSGGALVNLRGELIGVNTAIVSQNGGNTGIGFAIPSNLAKKVMAELVKDGKVTRGWLGISIQTVDGRLAEAMDLKATKGVLVTSVAKGGPGDAAGLRRGDVILRMDDVETRDAASLMGAVADAKPGKEVDLTLMRGIKTLEVTVKVALKREEALTAGSGQDDPDDRDGIPGSKAGDGADAGARLGLQVAEPDQKLRRRYHTGSGTGVVVLGVEDGSRADAAGIKEGDFILEAGNKSVATALELRAAAEKGRKKGKLVLRVKRGEEVFFAAVRFG